MASISVRRIPSHVRQIKQLLLPFNSRAVLVNDLCTKAWVPEDVTKSKAESFGGERSQLFETEEVQTILKRLTGLNLRNIFAARKEELTNPVYKVLSENELKQSEENAIAEAKKLLRMPPVMSVRKPINAILSEDRDIINHDEDGANFMFTDISTSKTHRNRAIFVRENDSGILREATWDERDRMQHMYWPRDGQHHELPPMLQDKFLPDVFEQLRHNDVLDYVNIQCEPDAPDYIRVHRKVYDDVAARQCFHLLHSTRHYGGMIFYFVSNGKTNLLLRYYLRNERLDDAVDVVKLHRLINEEASQTADETLEGASLLKQYLSDNGLHDLLQLLLDRPEEQTMQA